MKAIVLLSSLLTFAVSQPPTKKPCTDWLANREAFDEAKAAWQWQEPQCYSYSYVQLGLAATTAAQTTVTVENGAAVGEGMSIDEFFTLIETTCFTDCPEKGAYLCTNTYAASGYPLSILLDLSEFMAGEERRFALSDFSVQDCPESPSQSPSDEPTASPTNTLLPSAVPTSKPTKSPTFSPTKVPSAKPAFNPTELEVPSLSPTGVRVPVPTASPTFAQTDFPTATPNTAFPTSSPTTSAPTLSPTTSFPTFSPTTTFAPTQGTLLSLRNALQTVALHPEALTNRSTPENAAMRWMHDVVTDNVSGLTLRQLMNDRARLRQRFAIVTLDFATQGGRPTHAKHATRRAAVQNLNECQFEGVTCNGSNKVTRIVWAGDQLKGIIPDEVGQLTAITHLDLGENELKGTLPNSLYDLRLLRNLYLHSNQISGAISKDISKLSRLVNLYMGDNMLIGTIPTEIGSIRGLRMLNLNYNQISGPLPRKLSLPNLYYLDLGNNELTGKIPNDWWEGQNPLSSLRHLYLNHNQLRGEIPLDFVKIGGGRLIQLHIQDNSFSGIFPGGWNPRTFLESLEIQHNNFSDYSSRLCGIIVFNGGELTSFGSDCRICRCEPIFCRTPHCYF